ncbi:hypothetical protein LEMLEM_LOCUS1995 [Lemmus lemmus]
MEREKMFRSTLQI